MKRLYFVFLLIVVLGCSEEKEPPFDMPSNSEQLLAGDSIKTWKLARRFNNTTRMNMGDCFLSYQVTYSKGGKIVDNNSKQNDCGESMNSCWSFYKSEDNYPYIKFKGGNIQKLMNLKNDYKFFKILDLNEKQMVLEFQHKQFSNKVSTIVDVYVPKDAVVEDRKFHW